MLQMCQMTTTSETSVAHMKAKAYPQPPETGRNSNDQDVLVRITIAVMNTPWPKATLVNLGGKHYFTHSSRKQFHQKQ